MNVYICSTYYHILISTIKCMKSKEQNDIVITRYIADSEGIYKRLVESNIFHHVYLFDDLNYAPQNLKEKLFWRKNVFIEKVEEKLDFDFGKYKNINIFMDYIWVAKYLKDKHIHYNIIEDALDVFKFIYKSPYAFMVIKEKNFKSFLKAILKVVFPYNFYGYEYYTDSKFIDSIEINDKEEIYLKDTNRLKVEPRVQLFSGLDQDDKKRILKLFCIDNSIISTDNIAVVFTYAFVTDKVIKTEEEQVELYQKLCDKYRKSSYVVLLKPHPRDAVNYDNLQGVTVLAKEFPSEIINFINHDNIKKYVSIFSHCVDAYPKEKVDYYELNEVL